MKVQLQHYRTDHGVKTVLVGEPARKYTPVLFIEGTGLTVRKVDNSEARYMFDCPTRCKSIGGLIRSYRKVGRTLGATKAAREFLRGATA